VTPRVAVAGGGAAGFFAAIRCAEAGGGPVVLLERASEVLAKVRISGGGRCNVTHDCFDARELSMRYPRGGRALIGPFTRFGPRETVAWFKERGVSLKTEPDGRMFPVTDDSASIIDCLQRAARDAGVTVRTGCGVDAVERGADGFQLSLSDGSALHVSRLVWAGGGMRVSGAGAVLRALGHAIMEPVPSLFSFEIPDAAVRALAGVSVADAEVSVPGTRLRERGPLLFTHRGVSGPVVLRVSAWGARELHARDYRFDLDVNIAPSRTPVEWERIWSRLGLEHGARRVAGGCSGVPGRLWELLVRRAGIDPERTWSRLTREERGALVRETTAMRLGVEGKSLNKDEFVTCGGVDVREVDFRTMESRVCPGLYLAGEALDVDGITGGFNFQAAWTTGWIAGTVAAVRSDTQ
jgi:hypothetical protein